MRSDYRSIDFGSTGSWGIGGGSRNRVLLREPERCGECGRVYISLYPISRCADHDGLDRI